MFYEPLQVYNLWRMHYCNTQREQFTQPDCGRLIDTVIQAFHHHLIKVWEIDDGDWVPEWITIYEARRNSILIKCGCTKNCSSHCSCQRADLLCTELCKCKCEV